MTHEFTGTWVVGFPATMLEGAMHLIEQKPEEKQEVVNAFEGIKEVPRWHGWMEVAIRVAALLTIADFLYRLFPA
jgi:hypothetical protein